MTTVEVLKAARAKLAEPGVWAKGDRNLKVSSPHLCAALAIYDAGGNLEVKEFFLLANGLGRTMVALWNDAPERTLKDVLEAFDRAIALAEVSQGKPEGET